MIPLDVPRPVLLIVDDDPAVLNALDFMAGTRGYAVRRCANGAQALAAAGPGISCLIIDQNLSDMQGSYLLQEIRAKGVDTPALIMTTSPSLTLRRQAAAAGVPIVEKPLLDEDLFVQIRRLTAPN